MARRRSRRSAASNEPREGREQVFGMFGKKRKKDQDQRESAAADEVIEQFGKRSPLFQRYLEMAQQTIRLEGNSAEMSYHDYHGALLSLRKLQQSEPAAFAALVLQVRPRGATQMPEPTLAQAIARGLLKDRGFLSADGLKVEPRAAAVLDAAYTESDQGVILRDVAIYPSPDFAEKLAYVSKNWAEEIAWLAVEEVQAQLKKHGREYGPSR